MFVKKKGLIGLDIGSSCIKVAKVNDTKAGYELAFFDMIPIHPDVITDGMIADKTRLVASIKELLKKAGIKNKDAVISFSGHPSVIIKKINMPIMSEEEISDSMKYEAQQYVPFDINDVEIDFQILGPSSEEGQMDIVLVAVKRGVMNDYVDAVKTAGLDVAIVDVDSFAIYNAYEVNYGITERNIVSLVNIGASTTSINVLRDGVPVYTKYSDIGSNRHTEALERSAGVSREDAERLKRGQLIENVSAEVVQEIINAASDQIYAEIFRSFEYFKGIAGEEEINKIMLSGGAVLVRGFAEMMEERLGISVEVMDPFKNIKIPDSLDAAYLKDIAPIATVAVGLALRRIGDR